MPPVGCLCPRPRVYPLDRVCGAEDGDLTLTLSAEAESLRSRPVCGAVDGDLTLTLPAEAESLRSRPDLVARWMGDLTLTQSAEAESLRSRPRS